VTLTGTVSDFDSEGLFGLIITDDGCLLPFNLRETPAALQRRLEVGTRVKFTRHTSEPTTRAIEVVPIDTPNDHTPPSATAREL
jgi:cold shock CspA family protein